MPPRPSSCCRRPPARLSATARPSVRCRRRAARPCTPCATRRWWGAPRRAGADARAPTPPKAKSALDDDDDDDDAGARRRLASPRATRVVIKAHGDRATSRRSSESSARAPRAASQDSRRARVSGRSPPIRLPATRGATFDDARRRTVVRASEFSVCPNRHTATIRKRPNSAFARGSR